METRLVLGWSGLRRWVALSSMLLFLGMVAPVRAGENLPPPASKAGGALARKTAQAVPPYAAYPAPAYPAPATNVASEPAKGDTTNDTTPFGWPFFAAVGLALIGGFVAGYYLGGSSDLAMPTTTYGAKQFAGARP